MAIAITFFVMTFYLRYQQIPVDAIIMDDITMKEIDSLLALPPVVEIDTIYQDTGSFHIIYTDVKIIAEPDSSFFTVKDTLVTPGFHVVHDLAFFTNTYGINIYYSRWKYIDFSPLQIMTTITDVVPRPVPYAVAADPVGLYLGIGGDVSGKVQSLGFEVDYLRKRFLYGVSVQRQFGLDGYVVGIGFRVSYKIY